jgi:dihydrolipoamide dehydrogenase
MRSYDVAVIGSGPGGYAAAIRAAQRGMKTVIVEKEEVGGVCLNWGCIPTKAIIHTADILDAARNAGELGIDIDEPEIDMHKIIDRSRQVSGRLSKGVSYLLKKHGADLLEGSAELRENRTVYVKSDTGDDTEIAADNIIIASGSHPKALPHLPIDGEKVISSRHALQLKELPGSMAVIGAGAIGVEFAYIYRRLGVEVTLIEAMDALLPNEDPEISRELLRAFKKQKITCMVKSKVRELREEGKKLHLNIDGPKGEKAVVVDKVLSAVGVAPNSGDLGLEKLGVKTEKGFIRIDEGQRTSVENIYAIGDVAGTPCLAHKATREAMIAVDSIQGRSPKGLNKDLIPACTYCMPQVASVGLRESDAEERDIEYKVSKVHYRAIGKAVAIGETGGFLKLVVDNKSGKVLGAHCIGAESTEIIAELTLALTHGMRAEDVAEAVHAHPTLHELVAEAAENVAGEAIHV